MSGYDYDFFVIGAGSGGVRAARLAAGLNKSVAIAEEHRVGGTCVIRGCVPKKLLVYASRYGADMEDCAGFGWTVGERHFNWSKLIANKDHEIDRLNAVYLKNLEKAGVELINTRAEIKEAHTLFLPQEGRTVTAEKILIATGGRPFKPDIPGHEQAITSNEAFYLERLPGSIMIVGGGYIAVEFAGIFHGLGSRVTSVYRGPQILRGFDEDMRQGLAEEMIRSGIDLRLDSNPSAIEKRGDHLHVTLESGETFTVDEIMFATGRLPNTDGLGAEHACLILGSKGEIPVDQYSKTSVDHIFAVGDVTDRVNLTPVAIHEAVALTRTIFQDQPTAVDHHLIPTAVFSSPEIGTVGMTEDEARKAFSNIDICKSRFRPMRHTLSGREQYVILKLIVDARSGRVLGCHILGPDAAEIVQMLAVAMRMGATKKDLDDTMALHPCTAEELVTMP